MEGWLFDVYPDHDEDRMVLWVLRDGDHPRGLRRARGFRHVFWPCMYVTGPTDDLRRLEGMLSQLSTVRRATTVERAAGLVDRGPRPVLELEMGRYSGMLPLARMIDRMGGFHDLSLYNVDLRLPARFMVGKGIFPMGRVRVDAAGGEVSPLDGQLDMDYILPDLRKVHMDLGVQASRGIPTLGDRLLSATLVPCDGVDGEGGPADGEGHTIDPATGGGWTVDGGMGGGEEETVLRELLSAVASLDPDVIFTANGDSFTMPYLYYRADSAGIGGRFHLGRGRPPPPSPSSPSSPRRATRQAKSYFSYGRIVYKPAAHLLRGRWHIDATSFHMKESGLDGLMDLSRISCVPVQEMSRLSPGTAISTMQVLEALRDGYLVAWKKNIPETFKSARGLMAADRGGLILEPRVGVHDDVTEVDFASLYPNIMVRYNISPETLNCDCCDPRRARVDDGGDGDDGPTATPADMVPEAGYHFCKRREGLVPRVLRPVIARRFEYKRRSRREDLPPRERAAAKEMNDILKWLLVVCFGYTGYRNARFGRIECHESITSYAREIMVHAANIAESLGFEVLHGIVDSLWVKGRGDTDRLCDAITGSIGIPILKEGRYRWVVFLPNKTNGAGALNRYYGVFDDGEIKVRGVELRRRDTPPYLRVVQRGMLEALARGEDARGFLGHIPDAIEVLRRHAEEVMGGGIDPRRLVFTHHVSQGLEEYRHFGDQVAALRQLKERGFTVRPGQAVRFVVTDASSMDWRERVKVAEFIDDGTSYDRRKYLEHLCRCGESLLRPFGYPLERLMGMMGG